VIAETDSGYEIEIHLIRNLPILETNSEHFLKVLAAGSVSTNVYLPRIHNFALDMNWLSWSILPKRQWPKVKFKEKRAITLEEHQRIIAAEVNPERKTLYQLCWHLGAVHRAYAKRALMRIPTAVLAMAVPGGLFGPSYGPILALATGMFARSVQNRPVIIESKPATFMVSKGFEVTWQVASH
jgi:hypothetical protein